MNKTEQILEKIKKLVKHQKSAEQIGSIKEAEAFAKKIQQLLNQYNLSLAQLPEDVVEREVIDIILERKIKSIGGNSNYDIIKAIAKNNWCDVYLFGTAKNNQILLIGSPENIKIVRQIAEIVTPIFLSVGKDKYKNEYKKEVSNPVGLDTYMRRFLKGASKGLDDKLRIEKEKFIKENDTEKAIAQNGVSATALVRTNEIAIRNFVEEKYEKPKTTRTSGRTSNVHNAFEQGYKTGRNVNLFHQVESRPIERKMLK